MSEQLQEIIFWTLVLAALAHTHTAAYRAGKDAGIEEEKQRHTGW